MIRYDRRSIIRTFQVLAECQEPRSQFEQIKRGAFRARQKAGQMGVKIVGMGKRVGIERSKRGCLVAVATLDERLTTTDDELG